MSQKKKNNAQNDTKQNNETQKKHNNNNNENKNETQKKQNNNTNNIINNNNNKKNENNKNNETKPTNVILKVDMHCEGCSSKIVKFIQGFEGFEKLDIGNGGKLTVTGTVDAGKLRDNLTIKTKKKVDFISPVPKKDKENKSENENKNKQEDKKPKEPPVTTAVLKLELHCQGCTEKIRKTVLKTKGVQHVTIDKEKEIVTVKGTMDMKVLVEKLKKRFKRKVEVVPAKKEKEKEKEKENEKVKEKGENDGGNKKNNQKGGEGGGGGGKKKGEGNGGENIAKKEVLTQPSYGYGNGYGYGGFFGFDEGYNYGQVQMMHMQEAPQMFSDENPNACSVM
ncbi:heavy metal-associated isoprenylated plant protein 3 [Medicago truncatula]|uniref:Heavy-metal-associated domain protein n=1 Tax=Medicago truncatula TaxID=3880 RepID=G8A146_MEDTR|nr:heavy metal-associated isoprenylated plant protein 3 [Medicago truncatula]KEH39395.1 heavy-metal-associated domain protein [Medicago truncatula]